MQFDVRKKVDSALESNNIALRYGKQNSKNLKYPISTASAKAILMNSKQLDIHTQPTNQNKNNSSSCISMKRNRASEHSVYIVKGQKCAILRSDGSIPSQIHICLGWDLPQSNSQYEIDASAFVLGNNEKILSDEWFIFYGQTISPDSSVKYYANKEKYNEPDDVKMQISLCKISPAIQKITVCITIYEAILRGISFAKVNNLYARVIDEQNNELFYQPITDLGIETSVVIGELYRYKNTWKYCAVSSGYKRDLAQFCELYGVQLE